MATKTTKRTTTTRRAPAKKTTSTRSTSTRSTSKPAVKNTGVMNVGCETDYKVKYHVMCVATLIFAVISGVLFWAFCNKQSEFEDYQNCVAEDANCTVPNKRAKKNEQEKEETSYYNGNTVIENAVSAAGQE